MAVVLPKAYACGIMTMRETRPVGFQAQTLVGGTTAAAVAHITICESVHDKF